MLFKLTLISLLVIAFQTSIAQSETAQMDDDKLIKKAKRTFGILPKTDIDVVANKAKIELGKKLYFEKKLSINDTISCNSCHMLDKFGVDNQPTSPGHNGKRGDRNSPTVYNASLQEMQFWDGRAEDVEAQALGPILNPIEHGLATEADAVKKIDTAEYQKLFAKAFTGEKTPLNFKNIGNAIGAFERTLLTPSRMDDFMQGNKQALSATEKRGLNKFMQVGCTSCHNGVNFGGEMYQKMGLAKPYPTKDLGRYNVTKKEGDKFLFKVPQLRNISKTGPYLHDGSIKSLDEVIRIMAQYQLARELSAEDISDIKAFLTSLDAKKLPKI